MEYNGNLQAVHPTCPVQYVPLLDPFISLYKFMVNLLLFFPTPHTFYSIYPSILFFISLFHTTFVFAFL